MSSGYDGVPKTPKKEKNGMERDYPINVILVEDDEVDVMTVLRALRKNNIQPSLHVAANGIEALALLNSGNLGRPENLARNCIIWLDLNMPKMGGLEFLKVLRADRYLKSIPVVVLTTSDQEQDRIEAYNLNVAGYILKPVTFSKFVEVIKTLSDYWALCETP
jgi:CheY-like chemotaxis protein